MIAVQRAGMNWVGDGQSASFEVETGRDGRFSAEQLPAARLRWEAANIYWRYTMSRIAVRPFLISKVEDGSFRLTVRETRYNSQNYPVVKAVLQSEVFASASAAKAHARLCFGALNGQFATE